uniref:Uncharacterized protein n=1 Tax=Nelumbo nucifera TaxID=4432 RepID=A0A822YY74_NELNU|nr:TPA_asm: hypothetical protein HUJ06_008111 [Nelumbo nucifera]
MGHEDISCRTKHKLLEALDRCNLEEGRQQIQNLLSDFVTLEIKATPFSKLHSPRGKDDEPAEKQDNGESSHSSQGSLLENSPELVGGTDLLTGSGKEIRKGDCQADSFGCEPANPGKFSSHNSPAPAITAHRSKSQTDAPHSNPLHIEVNFLRRCVDSPPKIKELSHPISFSDDTSQPLAVIQAINTGENQEAPNTITSQPSLRDGGFTTNPLVSRSAKSDKSPKFTLCINVDSNPDKSTNASDWHPTNSTTEILSWNCQGGGSRLIVLYLNRLLPKHHPDIFFISETKNNLIKSKAIL